MNAGSTRRYLIAVAAALALSLFAAACSSTNEQAGTTDEPTNEQASTSVESTHEHAGTTGESGHEHTGTTGESTHEQTNEQAGAVGADTTTDNLEGLTAAGIEAAQWSDNIEITYGDGTFRYVSDGIPSHEYDDQYLIPLGPPGTPDPEFEPVDAEELVTETPLDGEITLNPVYSEETTSTSLGMIGVMISGAQLFNDYEDPERSLVAIDGNVTIDGVSFIDACSAHTLAQGGDYHYHGVPYCISEDIDEEGEHSKMLGVLLDGFPYYGPQDEDGSTLTSDDLDECSGHEGPTPEFPEGIYHYHLTKDQSPYSIDCFHGEIDAETIAAAPVIPPHDHG
ncbi:MAG: YHYH protein [Rubrobacteraceae bacterium]